MRGLQSPGSPLFDRLLLPLGPIDIQIMTWRKWWFCVTRSAADVWSVSTGSAQSRHLQAVRAEWRSALEAVGEPGAQHPWVKFMARAQNLGASGIAEGGDGFDEIALGIKREAKARAPERNIGPGL